MATTRIFQIDSSTTPQPSAKSYIPRSVVGADLNGRPIVQGYDALECTWERITKADMVTLMAFYDPADPAVTIQYTDPTTGADVTKNAMMEPPRIGGVAYGYFSGVVIRFSHLTAVA